MTPKRLTYRTFLLTTANLRPTVAQTFLNLAMAEIMTAAYCIWHTNRYRLNPIPSAGVPQNYTETTNHEL